MNFTRSVRAAVILAALVFPVRNYSQSTPKPDWKPYQFLIGEWIGESSGGTGGTIFKIDIDNQIIIRNNWADYPAANNRPASSHRDLMIIYTENNSVRAIYFDNEGHVIHYTVGFSADSNSLYLTSEINPAAPRFKFTYTKISGAELNTIFEIAPPGKPEEFSKYVEGVIQKKN